MARESEIKPRSGLQAEKKITQREELTRKDIVGSNSTGGRGFLLIISSTEYWAEPLFACDLGHKAAVIEGSL